jgi:uncharacterized protein
MERSGMRATSALAVRLMPGADLRESLERIAAENELRAACIVSAVGSLHRAAIRYAGKTTAAIVEGPLEIVSLSGTLSPDGCHLHVSVADSNGIAFGGHLGKGSIVHTTAEVMIGILHGVCFARRADQLTGYRELVITDER